MGGANGGVGGGWARLCGSVRRDYLFRGTKSLETEKRNQLDQGSSTIATYTCRKPFTDF